ncbi:MAG: DUF4652 domain-containing protein [Oscillospiraceae bacterium]|nr:DUF4652 domain-containing protein [Oscillospiraceae bacterium]
MKKINSQDFITAMEHIGDDYIDKAEKSLANPAKQNRVKPFSWQLTGIAAASLIFVLGTVFMLYIFRPDEPVKPFPPQTESTPPQTEQIPPQTVYEWSWIVEPKLEYEHLWYCVEHDVFTGPNTRDVLDEKTGLPTGEEHIGHGGHWKGWVYHEDTDSMGWNYSDTYGSDTLVYPKSEFAERFPNDADTIKDVYFVGVIEQNEDNDWIYPDAHYKVAIAVGSEFVTDFIYTFGEHGRSIYGAIETNIDSDKSGLINRKGEVIVPFEFEEILIINEYSAFAKVGGKYGILAFGDYDPDEYDVPDKSDIPDAVINQDDLLHVYELAQEGNIDRPFTYGRTRIKCDSGDNTPTLIMYGDREIGFLRVYSVRDDGSLTVTADEIIFRVCYQLTTDYYIEFTPPKTVGDEIPMYVVTFYDGYFDEKTYILQQSMKDGLWKLTESDYVVFDSDDYDFCNEYPLADNAVLLVEGDMNDWDTPVSVRYENEEPTVLYYTFRPKIKISPDKTKVAHIQETGSDFYNGDLSVYDVLTKKLTYLEFDGLSETDTTKDVLWLDDEILLVIIGFNHGTVTRGGDIYYYNIVTGENGKIIENEVNFKSEFVTGWFEIRGNDLRVGVCVHFGDGYVYMFEYWESFPLSRVRELIGNGELLVYEVESIDEQLTDN